MINVNQITSQLAQMPDPMLQKYAAMHKDDPYTVSLALAESNRRKAMRVGANPMPGEQPKVVDQDIAEMAPPQQMPHQMPQQMAQQQLPENVGIGQLPAQNMQGMADGGIVGFADGGDVQSFRNGGSPEEDAFNQAFLRTLKYEGGRTNDTGGDTKYGISKKGNPDVDIDKLTIEGARRLYKERYWDAINGDRLAARDPKLAQVAFDTAVNQSPAKAKEFVTASGGDVSKLMQLRGEHYDNLVQNNPKKYGEFAKGWAARLGNLATDLAIPSAIAGETTNSAPAAPASAPSPVVTKPVAPAAASALGTDNRAWYDRYRDLAMSGEAQKAMLHGVQDVPSSLVGAPVDLSYYIANKLGRTPVAGEKPFMGSKYIQEKLGNMGLRAADSANPDIQNIREATTGIAGLYNPLSKTEAVETAAQAIARRARENAPKQLGGPTVTTATETAPKQLVGPTVTPAREAELVKAAETEANAARAAREAELVKAAQTEANATSFTPYVEGPKAPQVGRIAAAQDVAGDLAARTKLADVNPLGVVAATPTAAEGITSLVSPDKQAPAPAPELPPETKGGVEDLMKSAAKDAGVKPSKYKDDMALMFFLNLMGGKSPNALANVSQAGLGALKYGQELKKEESEQMYREALAKHYGVDPMIQRAQALQDPAIAKQFAKMKELEREPVTRETLLKSFMGSPEGMAASTDPAKFRTAFQNYIQSYESVLGPIGGLPAGTKVTRVGP
jgi:hypothetical protein